MEEHNQEESLSEVEKYEDNEDAAKELTTAPLKRYVTMFGDRNANKWICNFGCRSKPYTGTYGRIRTHLIGLSPGQKPQGVAVCSKVMEEEREKMRREEDHARRVSRNCTRTVPLSSIPTSQVKRPTSDISPVQQTETANVYKISPNDEVDESIARFFYGNGIPFNATKSPFWVDMVRAINEAPRGYEPPSAEKIKTVLLDKEKTKVDQALMPMKQKWPTYGVSIVLDDWENTKKEVHVKLLAVSEGEAILISSIDCSREDFSSEFIAECSMKALESVGAYNVVQILTNNTSAYRTAGNIIEAAYPHIFWSGCIAHTLGLLLKEIVKSTHPSLSFAARSYSLAKGIMNYIKNHSSSFYVFRPYSELDILRVKKRKYGQHYVVLAHIFQVKSALTNLVMSEEWDKLKIGRLNSSIGHEEVKKAVLDDDFWEMLKVTLMCTKPIWDLIRYCDSDKACIGGVYQKMNDLLGCLRACLSRGADLCQEILNLVAMEWEKVEIPLHSLAYVLTPYYYSEDWLASLSPCGEERNKPHTDPGVHRAYLNALDRLIMDPKEASLVRNQLSDFISNRGFCAPPQAIKDRKTMSALSWWHLYGVKAPELYNLAVKLLSQSVSVTCAERLLTTYDYIRNVKSNIRNARRADSVVYVHYNHRLLTRHREDYKDSYKNWDDLINDDDLEIDVETIEKRKYAMLYGNEFDTAEASLKIDSEPSSSKHILFSESSFRGSSDSQMDGTVQDKKPRFR